MPSSSHDLIDSTGHLSDLFLGKKQKEKWPMESFSRLFGSLLLFVYHCFDHIAINGYLGGLSRPEQVVYFFRDILGRQPITKEVLSERTQHYRRWVEAFARNHAIPMQWAEKGVRKEDFVLPWLRRMERQNRLFSSRRCGARGRSSPQAARAITSWLPS